MHPPFGGSWRHGQQPGAETLALHFDPPSSLIGGEDLLARIYDAIRTSSSATGSNHLNTTLLVTFDEHGGTYDHVAPPPAVAARPQRRPPARWASPSTAPGYASRPWRSPPGSPNAPSSPTTFRATSLLATMRERFNLGPPLTARDASAPSFADIFTLTSPRKQEDWPLVAPRPVPAMLDTVAPLDAPLGLLGTSLLHAVMAFAQGLGKTTPDIKPDDTLTGADAIALGHEALGDVFPAMRD